MRLTLCLALALAAFFATSPAFAADPDNRMREALRNTMLQLRSCETERAALQAGKVESDESNKGLTAKVESLQAKSDKAEKAMGEQAAELAKFKEAIAKWQAAYQQATDLAGTKENERARLAGEVILLQRKVEDQQRKNAALFKIGNEVLTRYEHFGLGDALAAKEPFIGITRVKMQNLVQDYKDQLSDQRIAR